MDDIGAFSLTNESLGRLQTGFLEEKPKVDKKPLRYPKKHDFQFFLKKIHLKIFWLQKGASTC